MVQSELNNGEGILILRPNRSATWGENQLLIAGLGFVCFLIALGWAFAGVWLILPFAGLEISLLTYFLYRVSRNSHRQVVVHLDKELIRIEQGLRSPEQSWQFPRNTTFIRVYQPKHPLEGPSMEICSADHHVDISKFLCKEDSEQLLKTLKTTGLKLQRKDLDIVEFKA